MNFTWFGHSCFLIASECGTRVLTDPYDDTVGYPMHKATVDVVTVSHDHFDHNYLAMASGEPLVLREAGVHEVGDLRITGILSSHDDEQGKKRGKNMIFLFEGEGIRVAHMGDIGEMPAEEALKALAPLDVLMVPVGGTFTIGPDIACKIANATKARVVVPMHYQTGVLRFADQLLSVNEMISCAKNCSIHKLNQSHFVIRADQKGEDRLLVPDYLR